MVIVRLWRRSLPGSRTAAVSVAAVASLLGSAWMAAAAQATSWQPAVRVSAAGESAYLGPRVTTDANGDMMVAWLRVASLSQGTWNCPCVVRAAFRPAGGSFGAPVDVSPSMPNNDSAQQIYAAMDSAGDAIVAWNGGQDPSNASLYGTAYAAIRPAGGSFGTPVALDAPTGNNQFGVAVDAIAMDAAGDAIAGITGEQPYTGSGGSAGDQVLDAEVITRPAGGSFDAAHPQILTDGTHNGYLRALAMSPAGKAVVAVRSDVADESQPTTPQPNSLITMTSSGPGATFANSHTIETVTPGSIGGTPQVDTGDSTRPDAAINDSGAYAVIYNRSDPNGQEFGFNTTPKVSINGASPGTSLNSSGATNDAADALALDASGDLVVGVSDSQGKEGEAIGSVAGGVGPVSPLNLPVPGAFVNAANESGSNGQILYAFDAAGTNQSDVDATIGSPTGSFPTPTTLASNDDPFGFGVGGAIDKSGDAGVAWLGGSSGSEVHVAVTAGGGSGGGTTHTLTVNRSGSGTVTSSPSGISCGSTCSHSFAQGTKVTLTATPASGFAFVGWSGGGCTGTGSCQVTLNADTTVTAKFLSRPNTVITSQTINSHAQTATFAFKATGAAATSFQCALVKAPSSKIVYGICTSPKSYSRLAHGSYTFYVRARNAAGADPTPATAKFKLL